MRWRSLHSRNKAQESHDQTYIDADLTTREAHPKCYSNDRGGLPKNVQRTGSLDWSSWEIWPNSHIIIRDRRIRYNHGMRMHGAEH